ncbi:MAG: DUF63 family protein [Candidatus Nanohaloarchaea archaeon]
MFSGVKNFVVENFWKPALGAGFRYNIFNTSVYALISGLVAVYLYPLSKRMGVRYSRQFLLSVTPYIVMTGILAATAASGEVAGLPFSKPLAVLSALSLTVVLYRVSSRLSRLTGYSTERCFTVSGILMVLLFLIPLTPMITWPFIRTFLFTFAWAVPLLLFWRYGVSPLSKSVYLAPMAAHLFDATTTVVSLGRGGIEKNLVARYFIQFMGPSGIFVLKAVAVLPAVYYIENVMEGDRKRYYLLMVTAVGVAVGVRNLVLMSS